MPFCHECDREFGKYETPGKCPLCGMWAKIECPNCGRKADAKHYLDHGRRCSKCDARVKIPGRQSWLVPAGSAAVLIAFLVYVALRVMSA